MPTAVSKYHPRRAGCTVRQEWKRRFAHTIDHLRRPPTSQGCLLHSPTPDRRARFSLADPPTSRPHPEP
ncbi:hypothetical protein M0657_008662 [Pyricularia oryzae]|nr:hypothetical protein M9X92_008932 [Pyricularia oryzae]KAI7916334.1 hypothetical protein M0657_008662 [Pyricularia oryzae]